MKPDITIENFGDNSLMGTIAARYFLKNEEVPSVLYVKVLDFKDWYKVIEQKGNCFFAKK